VDSLRGQLLVASPTLHDPNFNRTVVLVCSHDEENGALGVVLNQPAEVAVEDAAPELAYLVEEDEPLFVGGPVAPERVLILAEWDDPSHAGLMVDDTLGFVGEDSEHDGSGRARVFAGHAGWAPGQLEAELGEDSWILLESVHDDVFSSNPENLWSTVLRRKGGRFELLARMPENPSLN
jgi:putative transcriptional regulator